MLIHDMKNGDRFEGYYIELINGETKEIANLNLKYPE